MPVEIRELIIKATVNQGEAPAGNGTANPGPAALSAPENELLQESIDQILQIMQDKKGR
jgi:hypothetical protein